MIHQNKSLTGSKLVCYSMYNIKPTHLSDSVHFGQSYWSVCSFLVTFFSDNQMCCSDNQTLRPGCGRDNLKKKKPLFNFPDLSLICFVGHMLEPHCTVACYYLLFLIIIDIISMDNCLTYHLYYVPVTTWANYQNILVIVTNWLWFLLPVAWCFSSVCRCIGVVIELYGHCYLGNSHLLSHCRLDRTWMHL